MKFWKDRWCEDVSLRDSFWDIYSLSSFKDSLVIDIWDGSSLYWRVSRQFND